ncbi:MAG: enoyl-CoA hydratase/isomerase family protein, partial [Planctomycetales bacterium]
KRNAVTRELLQLLLTAVRDARKDPDLRLLVLQAKGDVFCAGMDLAEMQQTATSPNPEQLWEQDARVYQEILWEIASFPQPTLAVLPGPALAGGVGLVLACDLVLGTDTVQFSLPEPKRGILAAVVLPLLLYKLGVGASNWLLLSGETCSASQALQWGLLHQSVPRDQLPAATERLIRQILTGSPEALAATKRQVWSCVGSSLKEQLLAAVPVSGSMRHTPDAREGLAAFVEKRPPSWTPNR